MTNNKTKGNQVSLAYAALRKKIMFMEIKPGQYLDEKSLMNELDIGRTPLRQAMILLKNENLIEGEPNRTPYVKEFSIAETKELFEALIIIEKNATYLASKRATDEEIKTIGKINERIIEAFNKNKYWESHEINSRFHNAIARASRNRFLCASHMSIRTQTDRLSYLSVSFEDGDPKARDAHNEKICLEHSEIIKCLSERDAKRAEKIAAEHIHSFHQRIANFLLNIDYV